MTVFLQGVGFGLVTAAIVALASVAFSLQFSVTTTPNFAHGELLTIGAYGALVAQDTTHNLLIEVVVASLAGAILATLMNSTVIQPFQRLGAKRIAIFLATVSISLIVQNVLLIIFGGSPTPYELHQPHSLSIGPFLWTPLDISIMLGTFVLLALLHILLQYTKFGKALRAVSDDPRLARVTGIPTPRVVQATWALDGAIAGIAGFVLAAYVGALTPALGFNFLVVVFAASVIGGLGRPYGTLVGALFIGVAMEVSASYLPAEFKTSVAFVLLILALLVRPTGLFSTEIWKFSE